MLQNLPHVPTISSNLALTQPCHRPAIIGRRPRLIKGPHAFPPFALAITIPLARPHHPLSCPNYPPSLALILPPLLPSSALPSAFTNFNTLQPPHIW